MANEVETAEAFLTAVTARLNEQDVVFCVLDEVSKDGTRQLVQQFGQRDPRVRLIWAPDNRCVVDAYFRGYREAMSDGCEWILEMDAGMSHDPAEIPLFVEAMIDGAEFAAGSRFVAGGRHHGRPSRYLLSKGGTLLAQLVLGSAMRDMTSGFECFSRKAMKAVLAKGVESRGHFFQTEIRHYLSTWTWVEVPINYRCPSRSVGADSIWEALAGLIRLRRNRSRGLG